MRGELVKEKEKKKRNIRIIDNKIEIEISIVTFYVVMIINKKKNFGKKKKETANRNVKIHIF